jgi:hypothetical protein
VLVFRSIPRCVDLRIEDLLFTGNGIEPPFPRGSLIGLVASA